MRELNTCPMLLVYNNEKTLFVYLDHIVPTGKISVLNEEQKVELTHNFHNSNFEKINLKKLGGDFTVKVRFENKTHTKHIHL